MGIPVGILFGFLACGWIGEFFGRRTTFFVVGIPGVLFSCFIFLLVKAPRKKKVSISTTKPKDSNLFLTCIDLMKRPFFPYLCFGSAFKSFIGYGVNGWIAVYFIRHFEMGLGEVGTILALSAGLSGGTGMVASGLASDFLGKKNKKWYFYVPILAILFVVPFLLVLFTTDYKWLAIVMHVIYSFFSNFWLSPTQTIVQSCVPANERAQAIALPYFVVNLIGLGFGPLVVGFLSDAFQSLQLSLLVLVFVSFPGALLYYLGSRTKPSFLS